ncbi:MAG: type I-F CRISPR-associated endoribonuclease Cas6/Csy4, partial [Legionella sp.]
MDYYINITILPDAEFTTAVLLNAIYAKCHKRLHDLAASDIGVSFPKAEQTLGTLLRLHGNKDSLQKLMAEHWLGGMNGYCEISPITAVPQKVTYRIVSRKQNTMSQSKLNRLIKRGTIANDQI